jgi:hypothetical protein
LFGESQHKYKDYSDIVKNILNPGGKFFITCCHSNPEFEFSLADKIKCYILWSGNDVYYPHDKDGFSKYAERAGLKTIYQEERTNDYLIIGMLYMSYYRCRKNNKCENTFSMSGFMNALFKTIAAPYYIHSYICYEPCKYYDMNPWNYQFIPQYKNGKWMSPETLQYILFEKQ